MYQTLRFLVAGLMAGVAAQGLAAEDKESLLSDKKPSHMKEKVVEARSKKYADTDGVSPVGRQYIYVDEDDIESATKNLRKTDRGRFDEPRELNIGSTTISNDVRIRSVDIVVKTDKKIDIKTDGKPVEVNLGQVKIEEGALKHRKLESNIIIDAEKGIVVH
jgi:hypothetical protein